MEGWTGCGLAWMKLQKKWLLISVACFKLQGGVKSPESSL